MWRGAFCGLARCLGREFGDPARLLVNRDAAFMGLLGISLDPKPPCWSQRTCCNPFTRPFAMADEHPAVLHAAAVTVCGLATKLADDGRDEGVVRRSMARIGSRLAGPATDRAVALLNTTSFPTARVMESLDRQDAVELANPLHADEPTATVYGIIVSHLADLLGIPGVQGAAAANRPGTWFARLLAGRLDRPTGRCKTGTLQSLRYRRFRRHPRADRGVVARVQRFARHTSLSPQCGACGRRAADHRTSSWFFPGAAFGRRGTGRKEAPQERAEVRTIVARLLRLLPLLQEFRFPWQWPEELL